MFSHVLYHIANFEIIAFDKKLFKPGAHRPARAWFLEIAFVREVSTYACVCVCVDVCVYLHVLRNSCVSKVLCRFIKTGIKVDF